MTETVRYQRDGHVALLTLNRPEALNAVNAHQRAPVWAGR